MPPDDTEYNKLFDEYVYNVLYAPGRVFNSQPIFMIQIIIADDQLPTEFDAVFSSKPSRMENSQTSQMNCWNKNGSKKWLVKSNRSANKTNIWVFHINTRRHYWSSCLYWPLNIQLFVINLVIIYLEFTVNFRIGNASQLFYSIFENGISVAKIRLLAFYSGIPNVLCNSSSISDLIQQKQQPQQQQKPLIST